MVCLEISVSVGDPNIKRGSGRIPLRNYTPPYVFSKPNVMGFFIGEEGGVVFCFVCVYVFIDYR